jgi:trk system potassium uptake protein
VHVIIVGAGEVGWYLAERLAAEHHDVVLIEQDEHRPRTRSARTSTSRWSSAAAATRRSSRGATRHRRAVAARGVTQNDEVNLIASLLAKEYGVPKTVVRLQTEELRGPRGAACSMRSAPTSSSTPTPTPPGDPRAGAPVGRRRGLPDGRWRPRRARRGHPPDSAMAGPVRLSEVGRRVRTAVAVPVRGGDPAGRDGDPARRRGLEAGDHVRVLTTREARRETLGCSVPVGRRVRRLMVLGGGAVGHPGRRAVVRRGRRGGGGRADLARAEQLAAQDLPKVRVIHGDITDIELLTEESVATMDVVVATTGEDTANVLACAFAAAEGAGFTIAVMHRLALLPLVQPVRHRRHAQPPHRVGQRGAARDPRRAGGRHVPRERRRGQRVRRRGPAARPTAPSWPSSTCPVGAARRRGAPRPLGRDRPWPHEAARRRQGRGVLPGHATSGRPGRSSPMTAGVHLTGCTTPSPPAAVAAAPRRRAVLAVAGAGMIDRRPRRPHRRRPRRAALLLCGVPTAVVGLACGASPRAPRGAHPRRVHHRDHRLGGARRRRRHPVPGHRPLTAFDQALFESISGFTTTGATVCARWPTPRRACSSTGRSPSGSAAWA